jgi:hypothetical protein
MDNNLLLNIDFNTSGIGAAKPTSNKQQQKNKDKYKRAR